MGTAASCEEPIWTGTSTRSPRVVEHISLLMAPAGSASCERCQKLFRGIVESRGREARGV